MNSWETINNAEKIIVSMYKKSIKMFSGEFLEALVIMLEDNR